MRLMLDAPGIYEMVIEYSSPGGMIAWKSSIDTRAFSSGLRGHFNGAIHCILSQIRLVAGLETRPRDLGTWRYLKQYTFIPNSSYRIV